MIEKYNYRVQNREIHMTQKERIQNNNLYDLSFLNVICTLLISKYFIQFYGTIRIHCPIEMLRQAQLQVDHFKIEFGCGTKYLNAKTIMIEIYLNAFDQFT